MGLAYTGTLKTVIEKRDTDRTYASMKSGGAFLNTAWFFEGRRIVNRDEFDMWMRLGDWNESVTLELE